MSHRVARFRPDRSLRMVLVGLLIPLAAWMGFNAAWATWYADRIFPGIYIDGVPVGGKTRPEALTLLLEAGSEAGGMPIRVAYGDRQWALAGTVPSTSAQLWTLTGQAFDRGRSGPLPQNLLARWRLLLSGGEIAVDPIYDAVEIDHFVSRIIQEVNQPPRPEVLIGGLRLPAAPGIQVSPQTLTAQIGEALRETAPEPILLEVQPVWAADVSLPPAPTLPSPLLLSHPDHDLQVALDPIRLNRVMSGTEDLEQWLTELRPQFFQAPRNAALWFDRPRNQLTVIADGRTGIDLDLDGTLRAVREALAQGRSEARIHLLHTPPAVTAETAFQLGINEFVGSSTTYFQGSSAARIHNIELTSQQFNGALVAPGGVFSFNDTVGRITSAAGYEESAIIWGDRTAVGVGGGVCQVSTTIFRAAYEAGFPIVERYNHGFAVSWYGEPGLDATIYTPQVDFQFRNDTEGHLLIQPVVDAARGELTIEIYGSKPNRTVTLSEPRISRVVEPREPLLIEVESLAPGVSQRVETEKPGMTVDVDRLITENGVTRSETLRSVYQPWRAVFLVGREAEPPVEDPGTGGGAAAT